MCVVEQTIKYLNVQIQERKDYITFKKALKQENCNLTATNLVNFSKCKYQKKMR